MSDVTLIGLGEMGSALAKALIGAGQGDRTDTPFLQRRHWQVPHQWQSPYTTPDSDLETKPI
jgi:pyrroline-5-carboxylate reductase